MLFFLIASIALNPIHAFAAVNYNRLMDDFVFSNSEKMTAAQIDTFLNSFPNSCISTHKGFKAPDVTGYSPTGSPSTGGFSYGSDVTAGTIISHAAHVYGLNPQVILTTLQKEESLVTGGTGDICPNPTTNNGSKQRYSAAMGNGCPDAQVLHNYSGFELYSINGTSVTSVNNLCVQDGNGHADSHQVGFSRQVIIATWKLKFWQQRSLGNTGWNVQLTNYPNSGNVWDNSDDPDTCYRLLMTQGYRKQCSSDSSPTFYDGYATIDGSSVHIDTGATAALYNYTPHKSGNLNFFNIFTSWFGSTLSNPIRITIISNRTSESGGTATVEYYLVQQPTANVTIPLLVSNTAEGTLGGVTSLTITSANWNVPQNNRVTITGVDDNNPDGDISYSLIAGKPSSSDPAYDNLSSTDAPNAPLINTDNEPDSTLSGNWSGSRQAGMGLKRGNEYFENINQRTIHDFHYGGWTDEALVGKWTINKDAIGLKRGNEYFLSDNTRTIADFHFGKSSDTVLVGDWDGDGKDEIGLKRGNQYFLNYGNDGTEEVSFFYGRDTDIPLVGSWDGSGKDAIGLKRGNEYFLSNNHKTIADFHYGADTDIPLVGSWDGSGKDAIGLKRGNEYFLSNNHKTIYHFTYGR